MSTALKQNFNSSFSLNSHSNLSGLTNSTNTTNSLADQHVSDEERVQILTQKLFPSIREEDMLSVETLLDFLVGFYEELNLLIPSQDAHFPDFLSSYESLVKQIKSSRYNKNDFIILKNLAQGQFGTVSVVKHKITKKIYAMKTLNKLYVLRCKELSFYMQERNVLKLSEHSNWFPKLLSSFQDSQNLYFVMEFAGGGDLLNLLGRQDNLVLNEEETRFYMAEIILAVNDLHKFGYTHRDIKPQNILIDNEGHVKLADFGSCIKLNSEGLVNSKVPVGTSDYISPEVLQAQEGKTQYGAECDWWSVGILMYELLQGDPPFYSDFTATTYAQIMNPDRQIPFPDLIPISSEARDLIEKLVCDREKRIGLNGVEEIQNHPFFNGIDWDNIRSIKPPFLPQLKSPEDTQYFEEYDNVENEQDVVVPSKGKSREFLGNQLPFAGFTYHKDFQYMPPNTNLDSTNNIAIDSQPIIKEPSLCLECQNRESNPPSNIDNSVLIEEKEKLVKEKEQLLSTLEECRKSLGQQNFINQKLLGEIKSLKVKLEEENNNHNESLSKIQVLESQNTSQSSVHEELKNDNQKLIDERDRAIQEVKKLKKAITEMSAVHKDIINTSTNLDQSRDQAQTNLEELQDKYDALLKENKRLLFRLRATESHPPEPPLKSLPTSSINTGSSFEREELARVKSELDITLQRVRTLTSDLKAMRQQNQSLSDTLENIRSQSSSVNGPPGTSLVSVDSKLYNEIVSNLELEARNHDLLISIQKELQARNDPDYKLSEAREMRDDAVAHANQLIELNERQASLIRTLMEKLTQMEQVKSPTRNLSPNGHLTDNIYDARTALMVVENEQLKRDLSFKDQKLQELVTKLVVMEASKPSFWAKGRSKDKQKILVHQVQSLESKLRLVERENSQLRYINRLTRGSPAPPVPPKPNNSGVESADDISLYDSSSSNLLAAKHRSLPPNASEGSGYQFNHHSTIPQHASEGSGYRFNESVITDRSINSQFGIQHIK